MKWHCLITTLVCSLGTICCAQEPTQVVTRALPEQLDAPPLPPGYIPPNPLVQPPGAGGVNSSPAAPPPPVAAPTALPANILAWDSESKDYNVKQGEMQA